MITHSNSFSSLKFFYESVSDSIDVLILSELVGTDGNFSPICVSATAAASCRIESVSCPDDPESAKE